MILPNAAGIGIDKFDHEVTPLLSSELSRWKRSPPPNLLHERQEVRHTPMLCDRTSSVFRRTTAFAASDAVMVLIWCYFAVVAQIHAFGEPLAVCLFKRNSRVIRFG